MSWDISIRIHTLCPLHPRAFFGGSVSKWRFCATLSCFFLHLAIVTIQHAFHSSFPHMHHPPDIHPYIFFYSCPQFGGLAGAGATWPHSPSVNRYLRICYPRTPHQRMVIGLSQPHSLHIHSIVVPGAIVSFRSM